MDAGGGGGEFVTWTSLGDLVEARVFGSRADRVSPGSLEAGGPDDSLPDAVVEDEDDDAASTKGRDDEYRDDEGVASVKERDGESWDVDGTVPIEGCVDNREGVVALAGDGSGDEAVRFGSDDPAVVTPLMDIGVGSRTAVGVGEGAGELDFVYDLLRCLFSGDAAVIAMSVDSSLTTASGTTEPAVSAAKINLIGGNSEFIGGAIVLAVFRFEGDFFGDGRAPDDRLWLEFDRDIDRDARGTTGFDIEGLGVTGTEEPGAMRSVLTFLPAFFR